MGGGGGGGTTASTSTTTTTSNTTAVTDRRVVADNGAFVIGENATGNTYNQNETDYGAIEGAFKVAGIAAETSQNAVLGATKLATEASQQQGKTAVAAFQLATKAADQVKEAFTVATDSAQGNRTLALAGLTLAAVLGISLAIGKK